MKNIYPDPLCSKCPRVKENIHEKLENLEKKLNLLKKEIDNKIKQGDHQLLLTKIVFEEEKLIRKAINNFENRVYMLKYV